MTARTLGVVVVDLDANGLGLPSRAAEPFADDVVLRRTLVRLALAKSVDQWILSVRPEQINRVRSLVGGSFILEPAELPDPSWRDFIRRGRKWSLEGWRGGVAGASLFDEEGDPAEFRRLLQRRPADWLVQARAESPMLEPALLDALVERAQEARPPLPLMYGGIPPGLAGWVYRQDFLAELAEKNLFPGYAQRYQPWAPSIDLSEQLTSFKAPIEVSRTAKRLLADHQEGLARLRRYQRFEGDARALCMRIASDEKELIPNAPRELEIEITTRRSHPTPGLAVARANMDISLWKRLASEYAAATDLSLVTMGGLGDPLLHPNLEEMIAVAQAAGVYGQSIVTDGLALTPSSASILLRSELDVLCVELPIASSVRGVSPAMEKSAAENVRQFLKARAAAGRSHPLVMISIPRARESIGRMQDLFDEWSAEADGVMIAPVRTFAGQMPGEPILSLTPPARSACARLQRRMMILSEGTAVSCSEDAGGVQAIGRASELSLEEIWNGSSLAKMRQEHSARRWSDLPLCPHCEEWHRP